jgi:hypothetical protein
MMLNSILDHNPLDCFNNIPLGKTKSTHSVCFVFIPTYVGICIIPGNGNIYKLKLKMLFLLLERRESHGDMYLYGRESNLSNTACL